MHILLQVVAKLFVIITLISIGLARPQHFGDANQDSPIASPTDVNLLPLFEPTLLQDKAFKEYLKLQLRLPQQPEDYLPPGSNLLAEGMNPIDAILMAAKRSNNRRLSTLYIDDMEPVVQNNRLSRGTRCFLNPVTCFKK